MGKLVDERYYEAVRPNSLSERIFLHARHKIYEDFLRICRPGPADTILDVGISDVTNSAANIIEQLYPHPERITAVGLGSAEGFQSLYPQIRYTQVAPDGKLPFSDSEFDIVVCNAVLEHVGSTENQLAFLRELTRVSRRLFLTVPNRFFPVEHHTAIPLLHWTDSTFAWACARLGKQKWLDPANLIMITRSYLQKLCPSGRGIQIGATGLRLGPLSSNLYLFTQEQSA